MITFGVSLYNLLVSPLRLIAPSLKLALWGRGQSKGGQELSNRAEMSELLLDAIGRFQSQSLRRLIWKEDIQHAECALHLFIAGFLVEVSLCKNLFPVEYVHSLYVRLKKKNSAGWRKPCVENAV